MKGLSRFESCEIIQFRGFCGSCWGKGLILVAMALVVHNMVAICMDMLDIFL